MIQRGRRFLVVVALSLAGAAMLLAGPGTAGAAPNPPGNNGTIKLDDTLFDDHPNNEPHVGCVFQVDFYGYDEGDLDATVTFEAHPPTLRAGEDQVLLTDTVFIGEDDNSGGGSEAGLDASATYTLDFTGIQPHPTQGFHVKVTINAEGSQGADVKHKVFWVTGCVPAPTTTSEGTTTTTGETTTRRRPPPRGRPRPQTRRPPARRPQQRLASEDPPQLLVAPWAATRPPRVAGCCRSPEPPACRCRWRPSPCSAWGPQACWLAPAGVDAPKCSCP